MTVNNKKVGESPETCLALVDYGRGVFNYKSAVNFATGSGFIKSDKDDEKVPFSLNFEEGGFYSDLTQTEPDSFKIGDKLFKLHPLILNYDKRNFYQPIEIKTHDNFVDRKTNCARIKFEAESANNWAGDNYLLIKAEMHYLFGKFRGWVQDDSGKKYFFKEIKGFLEFTDYLW